VVKLCGNMLIATSIQAMAEAFTLADENNLPKDSVY
jgi:3-hydroxyisobutyrate dehydrogenase-like beta-hydroxyacid dehydrogenase